MKVARIFATLILGLLATAGFCQPGMAPHEELKKLDWMIGEWTGKLKWTMEGMEGEGAMTYKCEWDGNFIKNSAVTDMAGMGKMTETAYLGWDEKNKQYVIHCFTNFSHDPRIERGTLDGNKLILVSDPWNTGGQTMVGRATTVKNDDGTLLFTLEFKMEDKWVKAAEGTFKKK